MRNDLQKRGVGCLVSDDVDLNFLIIFFLGFFFTPRVLQSCNFE